MVVLVALVLVVLVAAAVMLVQVQVQVLVMLVAMVVLAVVLVLVLVVAAVVLQVAVACHSILVSAVCCAPVSPHVVPSFVVVRSVCTSCTCFASLLGFWCVGSSLFFLVRFRWWWRCC